MTQIPSQPWIVHNAGPNHLFEIELSSWRVFHDFVNMYFNKIHFAFWRGQAAAKWPLESSLDRRLGANRKNVMARIAHLNRFRLASRGRRGPNAKSEMSENDWWALGQHFGLSTPLLDWTSSPFVALYFAFVHESTDGDDHRAVWAIHQYAVEERNGVIRADHKDPNTRPPIVEFIFPLSDENPRLVSQGGVFTRGPDGQTLEEWAAQDPAGPAKHGAIIGHISKIRIPNTDRDECLRQLNRMNINHLSLFPDLYGASKYCNLALDVTNYE